MVAQLTYGPSVLFCTFCCVASYRFALSRIGRMIFRRMAHTAYVDCHSNTSIKCRSLNIVEQKIITNWMFFVSTGCCDVDLSCIEILNGRNCNKTAINVKCFFFKITFASPVLCIFIMNISRFFPPISTV